MRFLTVEKNAFFVKFSFLVKINGPLAFANCPCLSVFTSFWLILSPSDVLYSLVQQPNVRWAHGKASRKRRKDR